MSKFGIENLKLVFKFVFDVAKSADSQLADGFQWTDVPALAYAGRGVVEVIKKRKDAGAELADLDEDEREVLLAWAVENFELADDEAEKLVEDVFTLVDKFVDVVNDIKDLKK